MKDLIVREFSRDVSVMVLPPHVFRRSQKRAVYKEIYRSIKQGTLAIGVSGLLATDCRKLAIDIVKCQLVKFGYKRLMLFCLYPASQLVGGVFYVFGTAPKVIVIGKTIIELGNQYAKGGMEVSNFLAVAVDVVLFGEPVPITENMNFSMLRNETEPDYGKLLQLLGPDKND